MNPESSLFDLSHIHDFDAKIIRLCEMYSKYEQTNQRTEIKTQIESFIKINWDHLTQLLKKKEMRLTQFQKNQPLSNDFAHDLTRAFISPYEEAEIQHQIDLYHHHCDNLKGLEQWINFHPQSSVK